MAEPTLPIDGACRCGALRLRIAAPPLLSSACHCTGCQRMTGSAFSLTLSVPSTGFAIVAGKAAIGGLHGPQARHWHCDRCKSWTHTTVEPDAGFVNVRTTMLDAAARFPPFMESWTSEALPWARTPATRSYPGFPAMSDYEALIAAYQAEPG